MKGTKAYKIFVDSVINVAMYTIKQKDTCSYTQTNMLDILTQEPNDKM